MEALNILITVLVPIMLFCAVLLMLLLIDKVEKNMHEVGGRLIQFSTSADVPRKPYKLDKYEENIIGRSYRYNYLSDSRIARKQLRILFVTEEGVWRLWNISKNNDITIRVNSKELSYGDCVDIYNNDVFTLILRQIGKKSEMYTAIRFEEINAKGVEK